MKQNQFIQSFMQNYMKNCQHYLTGEEHLIKCKSFGHKQYKPNVVLYRRPAVY